MASLLTATATLVAPDQAGDIQRLSGMQVAGEQKILGACWGAGPSIDQAIASRIGAATPYRSLELGVRSNVDLGATPFGALSYSGPAKLMPRESDPQKVFARLFSAPGASQAAAVTIDVGLKQRRSVLDLVLGEYQRLCARVGTGDKAACDAHLQAIREVERRFDMRASAPAKTCAQAAGAPSPSLANPLAVESFAVVGRQQMDLLALALACDLTRVATLQWSFARSPISAPWINVASGHHVVSHFTDDANRGAMEKINVWYTQQLAYLASKMKGIVEGERTLLDNSLIYYCAECAFSADHTFTNTRCVLVGRAGGALRTGRWLRFAGVPHGKLFVSILNAMGLDGVQFGDPAINGAGPLANLG
jgi:hypothetical protein